MRALGCFIIACIAVGCAGRVTPTSSSSLGCQEGDISYYAERFDGRRTANGEIYRHNALTAAHRTLPFGTEVEVQVGSRSVRLRINDRGPYARHRILDVSGKAADILGLRQRGHAHGKVCSAN